MTNDYIPTKITLTEKVGFDKTTSRLLREIAEGENEDPRQLAARLLREALDRNRPYPSLPEAPADTDEVE